MNISQLEVTLFGEDGFTINGQRISGFPSTKVLALGYYLAATGRAHKRESLATLL